MDGASVDRAIAKIAARQHSVFSREQAGDLATPKQITVRLRAGRWDHPHDSVYRLPGTPGGWLTELMVAVLAGGPGTAASHRAAVGLHGFEGFGPIVEVTVPRWARHRGLPGVVHESTMLGDLVVIQGIPTTNLLQTIGDVINVAEEPSVERLIDEAVRRKLVRIDTLVKYAASLGRRRGARRLRKLLARRDPKAVPTDTELEERYRRILRRARLPEPVAQYRIYDDGRFIARVDLAYPRQRIFVELDSSWHDSVVRRRSDLARQNALVLLGWTPLRFEWWTLDETPDNVADDTRRALTSAGWQGASRVSR